MDATWISDTNISTQISRFRREKGMTQDQLADFLGVTKASVSKWENRISMPDITLLPKLATYFDVTIDELVGYSPQLSKLQIQRVYQELSSAFSTREFESVMKQSEALVKKYYSCYPLIFQIAVLFLNHFMLAESQTRQMEILNDTAELCSHICDNATDVNIRNDAFSLKAVALLQSGKASEVIGLLEDQCSPNRMGDYNEMTLIQAYLAVGQVEKGKQISQLSIYTHLMGIFAAGVQYLMVNMLNFDVAKETINRLEELIDTFDVDHLHPNSAAQVRYVASMVYMTHGLEKEAIAALQRYKDNVEYLIVHDQVRLHGDAFFDRLEESFETLDLGVSAPRDLKLIKESFFQSLEHPLFENLKNCPEFNRLAKADFWRKDYG